MIKTIDEALRFIESQRINNTSLDDFRKLFEKYNNFQNDIKYIHVTGTNGKGSTSKMIHDILNESGYTVGLFTSPHMVVANDRIRINGTFIKDNELISYVNKYYDDILEYELNFFQIYTLFAIEHFTNYNVDFAVMEVGIGGLYDSTNVIDGEISIITNINMDHTDKLGKTISEIAYQKAGIIKEGKYTVTSVTQKEALDVIINKAKKKHSDLRILITPDSKLVNYQRVFMYEKLEYHLNTSAKYQVNNALDALETIFILKDNYHLKIDYEAIERAFSNFNWAGRFETISKDPLIVLDGAHNVAGIKTLVSEDLSDSVVIFSALKDKEYDKMLNVLMDNALEVIFCEFDFYRALKSEDLNEDKIKKYKSLDESLAYYKTKYPDKRIVICGSLYFVSDVRKIFKGE